ncbi:MAG: SRPBCC family protein [Anaerolineae bacterium]|nr:SRPBCC family protein [Anaerolineae bacterium]
MAAVEKSIIVNASPQEIWNKVKDPKGWASWFEGASAPQTLVGDGSVGTEVELTMTVAKLPLHSKLTVAEATEYERWKGNFLSPGLAEGYMLWSYMDMGRRTKLTFHIEADLKGAAKVAEGMVIKSFEEMADKTLMNVKTMLEG